MRLIPYLCIYGSLLCSHHIQTIKRFEPQQLKVLPDAVESGLVISYHTIKIPGLKYCYNPAYIQDLKGSSGTLIVRVDGDQRYLSEQRLLRKSILFAVRINNQLNAISKPIPLQTLNEFSEDPRAVRLGNHIAVICNEHPDIRTYNRSMSVHVYDHDFHHLCTYKPPFQLEKVEKNWIPLFQNNQMDFIYAFNPYTVISFNRGFQSSPKTLQKNDFSQLTNWAKLWGTPRGGTPFLQFGEKQLGFFHSSFISSPNKKRWFVFGAIELEAYAPYTPLRISVEPIYSKYFYQSSKSPTAPRKKFVVYPSGITTHDNDRIVRVFCGLNDSRILAIDLDRSKLQKSLKPI